VSRTWEKSRALRERALQSLAGGVSSPVRATAPLPLYYTGGKGARLFDVDGNEYIDYQLAWGPNILGYCHPKMVEAMRNRAEQPYSFGARHELEIAVAERIQSMVPCAERVAFTSSGSETVQLAHRFARAFTGRPLILKFEGHYRGWMDTALHSHHATLEEMGPLERPRVAPGSAGQSANASENIVVAPWNRPEILEVILERHEGKVIAGALQANRPYQPWADILYLNSGGDSTLHQLQIEAIKRVSHGLNFQIEYSWNRSLDDTPITGGPQNPFDDRGSRGNSDQVRRHVFTAAYNYELPFGPGKRFIKQKGLAGKLVGGWNLAGITTLRTGQPFSVTFSPSLPGWIASRADVINVGSLDSGSRSINRWFDSSGYKVPAPFTYGNSARNLLFGPGQVVFDMSLLKDTSITERVKVQFRAEFFNMPNHANFQNPGSNISSPSSVGKITSADDPRQIQFGLKLLF
jgi:Aminotransferase class-III